jgi:hypothetical protein
MFSPSMRWNRVLKTAAANTEFWDRELKEPATLYTRVQLPRAASAEGGPRMVGHPSTPTAPGGTGQAAAKRGPKRKAKPMKGQANPSTEARCADGRYFRDRHGTDFFFTWNRADGACGGGACPAGCSHACEWRRQPHRAIACPQHLGWVPTSGSKGSGRGGPHS